MFGYPLVLFVTSNLEGVFRASAWDSDGFFAVIFDFKIDGFGDRVFVVLGLEDDISTGNFFFLWGEELENVMNDEEDREEDEGLAEDAFEFIHIVLKGF